MPITYQTGDATVPVDPLRPTVIVHCVNNLGGWGSGFVVPLGAAYPQAKEDYLRHVQQEKKMNGGRPLPLGRILVTKVKADPFLGIAHLFGQQGIKGPHNPRPVDYEALWKALVKLDGYLHFRGYDNPVVQMPRLASGLAGGDWWRIEDLVDRAFPRRDVRVLDLPV